MIFLKLNDRTNIDTQIKNLLKENFIVADAEDISHYSALRAETEALSNNFDKSTLANPGPAQTVDYDTNPNDPVGVAVNSPSSESVDYDKTPNDPEGVKVVIGGRPKLVPAKLEPKSFVSSNEFGWDAPWPIVSCANSSISSRFKSGPKQLLPYQLSCPTANKISAENYYKTHFQAMPIGLNDIAVRGANYMDYNKFPNPVKMVSQTRILSQNTKGLPESQTQYKNIPVGHNYAFGGPVMGMP